MTKDDNITQLKQQLDEYDNFCIISWDTEENNGYETLTKYNIMSNEDPQTALMCVDAIISIMVDKKKAGH